MAAYHAAIAASSEPAVQKKSAMAAKAGTLGWLISRNRNSAAWSSLSPATRKQSEHFFLHVIESAGEQPFTKIITKTIAAARDRRKTTPFAAKNFLNAMRRLFNWAVESKYIDSNPTDGIKISLPRTDGFHSWSEEEVRQFEAHWPIGTRERLALATGFRLSDAARLGRQHIRDGVIVMRTEKGNVPVEIPILPELAEVIAKSKTGSLARNGGWTPYGENVGWNMV